MITRNVGNKYPHTSEYTGISNLTHSNVGNKYPHTSEYTGISNLTHWNVLRSAVKTDNMEINQSALSKTEGIYSGDEFRVSSGKKFNFQ